MKYKEIVPVVAMCAVIGAIVALAVSGCEIVVSEGGASGDTCAADGHCASGLHCFTNACRVDGQSVGVACGANGQCAEGLSCNVNLCSDGSAESACDADDQCAANLHCFAGACRVNGQSAATACSADAQCTSGLACLANRCSDKSKGSACDADNQCAKGLSCLANQCSDKSKGSACDADDQCAKGLSCNLNICSDEKLGSACNSNTHCGAGLHCSGNVCPADQGHPGVICHFLPVSLPSIGVCRTDRKAGELCNIDAHCIDGYHCYYDAFPPPKKICRKDGQPAGAFCVGNHNNQCASGRCEGLRCT